MDNLTYLFAGAVLLAATLAMIGIWAPRRFWLKLSAIGASVALMVVGYVALVDLLSRPKPVDMEWLESAQDEATVVSAQLEEGEAIYLWLKLEGVPEPRAYQMAWSRDLAKQLQDAQDEAGDSAEGVRVRRPFSRQNSMDDDEPVFYAAPQQRIPPKASDSGNGPIRFDG